MPKEKEKPPKEAEGKKQRIDTKGRIIEKMVEKKEKPKEAKRERPEFRAQSIIRLAETNLDGNRPVRAAIRRIKGVSYALSNAIANAIEFGDKKIVELTEQERKRLEEILYNPASVGIPSWLLNRRKDPKTGENLNLIGSKLDLTQKMDINEMKKIRSYKGVRHSLGQPVRGQRTRGSFRTGGTIGVVRKKTQIPAAQKKE